MMSCCGGCGFYRRRQVVLRQHQAASLAAGPPPGILNHGHTTYASTTMGHPVVAHPMMYPQAPPPQSYFSGPPSYNEVSIIYNIHYWLYQEKIPSTSHNALLSVGYFVRVANSMVMSVVSFETHLYCQKLLKILHMEMDKLRRIVKIDFLPIGCSFSSVLVHAPPPQIRRCGSCTLKIW